MDSLSLARLHGGMTTTATDTTLVLGATGKTGRRVAERLSALDVPVRAGSRAAEVPFDWEDRATWAPVLDGARAVYVTYQPDLAVPGAPEAVGELARLAVAAGVERLVLLSGRGEEEAQRAEEAVRAVFPAATIVRASWFAQNFSENFLADAVRAGVVALPVGDVGEPFVDADDIADVAVAALTEPGHAGRLYEVTGPRLLTFAQALEEIGRAGGPAARLERIPVEAFRAELEQVVTPPEAALVTYLFAEVLDGRNASVARGVQEALGRPPRDFADYARDAAAAGAWG